MRWGRAFGVALAAGLVLALAGSAMAQSAAPSITDRLNGYFDHPNAPETFRALTGAGDPHIAADDGETSWYNLKDGPDAALFKRLFPGADDYPGDCRPGYALEVLKARIARLGADHPYVRRWIEAQQLVFAACSQDRPTDAPKVLPAPQPFEDKALTKLQADDRAYQAASLSFYSGERNGALAAFGKIARSDSPHRAAAIYMRAAIRAGSHKGYGPAKPMVSPAQSMADVKAILADPGLAKVHPIARELLGWIAYNVADEATRTAQVRATLADLETPAERLAADPEAARRYALARSDIDYLHQWSTSGGEPGWWLAAGPPPDFTASQAMMQAAKTDPLAAWMLFPTSPMQARAWAPFAESGAVGWTRLEDYAKTASEPDTPTGFAWTRVQHSISRRYDPALWTVIEAEAASAGKGDEHAGAALSFDFYHQIRVALSEQRSSPSDDAEPFGAAIAAMKAFPFKDSEPYAAARHDGLQYLMTVGRIADARRWRDETPAADASPGQSGNGALLQVLAEDEAHFADALADRGADTLALQNNLSIGALRSLAARAETPAPLRAKFARVAWARTYALGRPVDADLDRLMRELNPAMTGAWTAKPGRLVRPNDRRALLDVLRSPGLNILIVDTDRDPQSGAPRSSDDFIGPTGIDLYNHDDDNWWCAWKRGRNRRDLQAFLKQTFFGSADLSQIDGATAYDLHDKLDAVLAQSFAFKSQDLAETGALAKIPCAPRVLTERVLGWVRRPGWFETRDGQDEALALAVKTTRYGCYSDGPHGAYSKAAWKLLHQRFPTSPWAIKTKYWFNCPFGDKECPAKEDD
jgi:hypothetical protein